MALYFYQAYAKDGKKVSGYIDASSYGNARVVLAQKGIYLISLSLKSTGAQRSVFQRLFAKKVSVKEKILFTKQLATLLRSGISLLEALELLVDHFQGQFHTMVVIIKDNIKEGKSFADALALYGETFDLIYVQLVRAGEASGNLEMILHRLTQYLEKREEIAKKISAALRYPMIQLSFSFLVVAILLYYVVPQMAENFAMQEKELPGATRILIGLSDFVIRYLVLIVVGSIAGVMGFRYWQTTDRGARAKDSFFLKLPLVKYFAKTNAIVQFSYTLGILTEGGVNLADSLNIVCSIIDNRLLADSLKSARDKIIKQGKIAQYLKQTNIFPAIAIYLIKTGEESGNLGKMLLTVAQNYEEELAELTDSLSAKLGPILLIIMALIVGFIVIAIALPMAQMADFAGGM